MLASYVDCIQYHTQKEAKYVLVRNPKFAHMYDATNATNRHVDSQEIEMDPTVEN